MAHYTVTSHNFRELRSRIKQCVERDGIPSEHQTILYYKDLFDHTCSGNSNSNSNSDSNSNNNNNSIGQADLGQDCIHFVNEKTRNIEVAIVMGSDSDLPSMRDACHILKHFNIGKYHQLYSMNSINLTLTLTLIL